jgi:DNA polymerase-3 subunit gamma/tau
VQAVPGALDAADPDADDARRLAPLLAADETQLLYSIVLHGRAELSLMSDEYGALTMVLLRFFAFPPAGDVRAPAVPVTAASPARAAEPVRVAEPVQAPPTAKSAQPVPVTALAKAAPLSASPAPLPATVANEAAVRPLAAAPRTSPPSPAARQAATPAARQVVSEPPPWLDEPPDEDLAPEPRNAPLRTAAAPALSLPVPARAADDRDPAASEVPVPAALADRWQALARRLAEAGSISAMVRELAWQGGLREVDEAAVPPAWTLVVERESLRSAALRDKLASALTAELGTALELRVEPGVPSDSPARRDLAERLRRQAEAEATITSDPLVAGLLAQFQGARIVPGSIKPV